MKLTHKLRKDEITKEVAEVQFLLANKLGGYTYFASKPNSKYQGVFFNHNKTMFKIIESIEIEGKVTGLINKFYSVTRKKGSVIEDFFMPHNYNALVYEIKNYPGYITLNLDFGEPYSFNGFGRKYNIVYYKDKLLIKYEKGGLRLYLVVAAKNNLFFEKVEEWKLAYYDWDKKRHSDCERSVFSSVKLKGNNRFVFSFSTDKDEAIKEADYVLKNCEKLKKQQEKNLFYEKGIKDKEIRMAYNAAQNSLNGLVVKSGNDVGIFAGYPWFFQFWTRDEMVSLKAVNKKDALQILKRQEKSLRPDGRLPNKTPGGGVCAADGIGWFVKRCYDFKHKPPIKKIARLLVKNYTKDGFAVNKAHKTWMDSLDREGARIEIQALRLNTYSKAKLFDYEKKLKEDVRERFWDGKILADGLDDKTIRTNIFLAAYVYPQLLTKNEWITCFENTIPKIWNEWGGLSSIDKTDSRYVGTDTGELRDSYHNGDSWFFINNMAALLMYKLDKKRFKPYIDKIIKASKNEVLYMGMVGHHAEISSSKKLESWGCYCQAWSNALFIDLVKELFL